MARPKFIAGNWKLNPPDGPQSLDLCRQLRARLAPFTRTIMAVCPPYTALQLAVEVLKETRIKLGAQDLYWEDAGAFTGEISAPMLKSAGCTYVIIGHSERRQYFNETNETVQQRLLAALRASLSPIVCVGETLSERESAVHLEVVREQISEGLREMSDAALESVIIAYEPVWAIGTGKTATPDQAQEMHSYIRDILRDTFGSSTSESTLILYGGSVKPGNAADLLSQNDIDGALVGGASLDAESFAGIINAAESIT